MKDNDINKTHVSSRVILRMWGRVVAIQKRLSLNSRNAIMKSGHDFMMLQLQKIRMGLRPPCTLFRATSPATTKRTTPSLTLHYVS